MKKRRQGSKNFGYYAVLVLVSLLTTSILLGAGSTSTVPKGYKLIWSDEFKQAPGTAPDLKKWAYTLQKDNQDEVEVYTTSPQNASIVADPQALDGSALRIQALKDSKGAYTSARIVTKDKFSFQYGYVECRAKLPYGQGMWPAFWTLGTDIDIPLAPPAAFDSGIGPLTRHLLSGGEGNDADVGSWQ